MSETAQMSPAPQILLWGAKSKARIAHEMILESGLGNVSLIFDATLDATSFETQATFTNDISMLRSLVKNISHYVVCIGGEHGYARFKTALSLDALGLLPITLVHHKGFVEPTSVIGKGCQIMPFALIHKFTRLGDHTIVNSNATVDHECLVGNGVHVMGSAAIAGRVVIEDFATIGTNATVLPNLRIGEGAVVGAGAVVTKNVAPYTVVSGVPAKSMRTASPVYSEDLLKSL